MKSPIADIFFLPYLYPWRGGGKKKKSGEGGRRKKEKIVGKIFDKKE